MILRGVLEMYSPLYHIFHCIRIFLHFDTLVHVLAFGPLRMIVAHFTTLAKGMQIRAKEVLIDEHWFKRRGNITMNSTRGWEKRFSRYWVQVWWCRGVGEGSCRGSAMVERSPRAGPALSPCRHRICPWFQFLLRWCCRHGQTKSQVR
jgi:hypothetical protein